MSVVRDFEPTSYKRLFVANAVGVDHVARRRNVRHNGQKIQGLGMGDIIQMRRRRIRPPTRRRAKKSSSPRMHSMPLLALVAVGAAAYFGTGIPPGNVESSSGPQQISTTTSSTALTGRASVIDGDTIAINGERIRFNGVDAPESSQTCRDGAGKPYRCGAKSAAALDELLKASSPTRCEFVERDRYGRFVGDCYRADGFSVQELLVRSGWAMDWPRYSNGAYAALQDAAKEERIGIWAGEFQPPWEWRAAGGTTQEAPVAIVPLLNASQDAGTCEIKGNISSKGERIYHLPGQEHYGRTKISTGKGERWFCSEAQARAAGWRPARR